MFLTTSDKIRIAADWYAVEKPKGYLVLTHMMPATKESWVDFANEAARRGYASIAIDLRGHGKSTGGPNGYKVFTDPDHQNGILDIDAACRFLIKKGAAPEEVAFVGASIGSNLSLQYVVEHPEFRSAVLLSPGLNYRGVDAVKLVPKLDSTHRVMLIASRDDSRVPGNAAMTEELFRLVLPNVYKKIVLYETGGHGTDMFKTDEEPDLTETILGFLEFKVPIPKKPSKLTPEKLKGIVDFVEGVDIDLDI